MARKIIFRYEDPDSTYLWNEMYRRMFRPGVYMGFAVSQGSNGSWWLKFSHETDPDNTSAKLGIIYTRDGAVIRENADQDNVANGSVSSGLPNIHYVIASYTYNAAVPQNDVAYFVRQGTPGTPPTPPSLGADEVLLAEIYVPSGAASYSATGVQIRNVGHLSLYGTGVDVVNALQGVLKPGIYTGLYSYQGTAWSKVSLAAGQWITLESHEVSEAAAQADKFTLTDPGPGLYRYAWIIGAHKYADSNPYPTADYLLVEGTTAAVGSSASLPTATAVRTVVAALNPKYDTDGDGLAEVAYVNYLGYVRVENRASTYYVDYMRGASILDSDTLHVYGARATSMQRSGAYYGHQGLLQAVEDVYAVSKSVYPLAKPYTLVLEGDFDLADTALRLPSHIRLVGNGAPARIRSNSDDVVLAQGFEAIYNSVNQTITQSTVSIPNTPTGYQGRQFAIQATYQVGDSILTRKFCKGDRVFISTDGFPPYSGEAIFVGNVSDWTFNLWVPDTYNTAGNPVNIDLYILKSDVHVENLDIDRISTGAGSLRFNLVEKCSADQIRCRKFANDVSYNSRFGFIEITNAVSWGNLMNFPNALGYWGQNTYRYLKFSAFTPAEVGALGESASHFDLIEFGDPVNYTVGITATVRLPRAYCKEIRFYSYSTGALEITGTYVNVGYVYGQYCNVKLTTISSTVGRVESGGGMTLEFGTGCQDTTIVSTMLNAGFITDTAANPTNRVLVASSIDSKIGMVENANSDRNLRMVSAANITWNSATGLLSWDAPIKFDNPWTTGYSSLASGSATLGTDGDRLYVDIDREATGTSSVTATVQTKVSAGSSRYAKHRVFIAVRDQSVIYLWDGTRIENGQVLKLGQTPPPDGSVTYAKLAASAKAFHNRFFRDYVVLDPDVNDLLDVDIKFRNTGLLTFTYTAGTGVIQYSGSADLSAVQMGDYLILREQDYTPGTGGKGGYTLEQILSVDDPNNRVTIRKGLDLTVGSANLWNGAIGRGGKILTNDNLTTYTYDSDGTNPGRVTYSSGLGFSQYQVRAGYVWLDSAGNKYLITDRDTTGNGDWITVAPGLRNLNTAAPTTKHHGSIETNYNPHRLPVADLRCQAGIEMIPINLLGIPDTSPLDLVKLPASVTGKLRCHYTEPYDPRIRVYAWPYHVIVADTVMAPNPTSRPYEAVDQGGVITVEFTGWCTGAVLCFGYGGQTSGTYPVWVDGEEVTSCIDKYDSVNTNNYGTCFNRYEAGINGQSVRPSRPYFLPPGIHSLRWRLDQNTVVSGVLVFSAPERNDTTRYLQEVAGAAIQDGGARTYNQALQVAPPTSDQSWDKGGRILRYIDKDGTRRWASRWVRGHTDTGDTSTGSADISVVANPSRWHKGDIVMLVHAGVKYMRVVTVKTGNVLTLNNTLPWTEAGATIYYYGTSFAGPGSGVGLQNAAERNVEEVAAHYPVREFASPGPISTNYSMGAVESMAAKQFIIPLSNAEASILSDDQFVHIGEGIAFATAGARFRFNFVGTGVSIEHYSITTKVEVYIDGAYCGLLPQSGSSYAHSMEPGTFIAGELPYGSHTMNLVAQSGASAVIMGFYVWQPALPEVPSAHRPILEIADANVVSSPEAALSVSATQDSTVPVIGSICQAAEPIYSPKTAGATTFSDSNVAIDAVHGTIVRVGVGGPSAGASMAYLFYGTAITLTTFNIAHNADPIYIEWLDHDGQWRVASALMGFSVTGIDSWTSDYALFRRHRWSCSNLGVHFIRVRTPGPSGQGIQIAHIEVECPYHVQRTMRPHALRHTIPWQHGTADRRNVTPFNTDLVQRDEVLNFYAQTETLATPAPADMEPFWLYSLGGPVEIHVEASMVASGGWTMSPVINGQTLAVGVQDGSTGDVMASYHVTLWLQQGYHYVYLATSNITNIRFVSWSARATRQGALNSPTRGLALPSYGTMGSREAAY